MAMRLPRAPSRRVVRRCRAIGACAPRRPSLPTGPGGEEEERGGIAAQPKRAVRAPPCEPVLDGTALAPSRSDRVPCAVVAARRALPRRAPARGGGRRAPPHRPPLSALAARLNDAAKERVLTVQEYFTLAW